MLKRIVNLLKQLVNNKVRIILCAILFLFGLVFLITNSFAASVPVKSIEIKSENLDYDTLEQGAWKVTKSASWISKGKARITFNIDSVEKNDDKDRDIILVIDNSASMYSGNFSEVLTYATTVLSELKEDSRTNRVSLITFNNEATIISNFTSDLDSLSISVKNIVSSGDTNYYKALVKVDKILSSYNYNSSKKTSVVFLTDGKPTADTPNEVAQYEYLKNKYNYLNITAIQYDMGDDVLDSVKNISDKQYVANKDNIKNILHRAMFGTISYDSFKVDDTINTDYFDIDSVSSDDVTISNNKVYWTLNNYDSGSNEKLTIDISLKDKYLSIMDLYSTNTSLLVTSMIDNVSENVSSSLTPVIANYYTITYESNAPSNCTVSNMLSSNKYYVFDIVSLSDNAPVCSLYQFKGWEVVSDNVTLLNDDSFIMPEDNVVLEATWSKLSINKTSSGTVEESVSLYKVLQNEATSGGLALEYTDSHNDTVSGSGTSAIYYYHGSTNDEESAILNKNNVLFAGMCWQMIRTTDTGGVKMIYNGEPDSNGACGTSRSTHVGYDNRVSVSLSSSYYYGTDYEYNSSTKLFKLSGTITQGTWSDSTYQNMISKYTCLSSSSTGTCDTLYYVESYSSSTDANAFKINSSSHYSQFGTMMFNNDYNSPSYVGYMYDVNYNTSKTSTTSYTVLKSASISTSYYFASSYTYNSSTKKYSLTNPSKVSSTSSAKGKYTFRTTSSSSVALKVFYVVDVVDDVMYYIELTSGISLDSYKSNNTIYYSDSYTENSGYYTPVNPSSIDPTTWTSNYSKLVGKYVFESDGENTDAMYVTSTSKKVYNYIASSNEIKFGYNVSYSNGKYTLTDGTVSLWNYLDSSNVSTLGKYHYTCLNANGQCENVYYVHNIDDQYMYYITLSSGDTIDKAVLTFTYNSTNSTDSIIKKAIDAWYKHYLLSYESYLDDVIYCNDRSISDLGGWNPKNGNLTTNLLFKGNTLSTNLVCSNTKDSFSVSNSYAKLTYPVGLMTSSELNLLGGSLARVTGSSYWLMTPNYYGPNVADIRFIATNGYFSYNYSYKNYGVRPAISLVSGTTYVSGDGSMTSPYVVPTN